MIKAVFFDIDGTLLSFNTHRVSEGTQRAFARLHERGIRTFIASGRPAVLIPNMPIPIDGYVTVNGGYCYVGDTVVCNKPIAQQESLRWLDYVGSHNLVSMAFLRHDMCINRIDEATLRFQVQLDFKMPPVVDFGELRHREVYQYIAMMPAECDAEVAALLPGCRLPRWHPAFSDVINAHSNKAIGIQCVLDHRGVSPAETAAFGDDINDISFLKAAE